MAGAVERRLQILEDLLAGPGSRILLPAIGQSGEILGIANLPHTVDEVIVLAGEAFVDEQCRRLTFARIAPIIPSEPRASRSIDGAAEHGAGEPIRYSGRISVVNQLGGRADEILRTLRLRRLAAISGEAELRRKVSSTHQLVKLSTKHRLTHVFWHTKIVPENVGSQLLRRRWLKPSPAASSNQPY